MRRRTVALLLLPLIPLILAVTFTAGSVLGSDLAQSVLQPYSQLSSPQAARPVAGPPRAARTRDLRARRGAALLAGAVLILVILLVLVLISKDGTWDAPSVVGSRLVLEETGKIPSAQRWVDTEKSEEE